MYKLHIFPFCSYTNPVEVSYGEDNKPVHSTVICSSYEKMDANEPGKHFPDNVNLERNFFSYLGDFLSLSIKQITCS